MRSDDVIRFLTATLDVYRMTARRTGRTTAMLAAAQPGDLIIVAKENEMMRLRKKLAVTHRDKEIQVIAMNPQRLEHLGPMRRNYRTIHFDHDWLELFYQGALFSASSALYFFSQECTLPATPPPKPPRDANFELSRFQLGKRNLPFE
ncbi:hypothetical protein [Agrobacterium pusense]|uniref:hypothetical protein n=1 Tax=Agrobacterium pusense TaxID=648995 RepID=UPI00055A0491|nr:hypothetical protein [Agrobacterium pusense]QWW74042.1 hypothetical protein KP800_00580 [Agrobacterium pusense]